ncbi:Mariner Mos1 transposase [Eumeta japonica]|uniref:Mariner Mos1 transposase n=1 Tax=Eumeta variegata TaxID=151549 RepID=A0A4C1UBL8_EUMVA|nr:Mariner Mos1 transposase [Eumeta japonica]
MLCIWWDWKGITHYEPLPPGKTINSDFYCQQLMRLKQEINRSCRQSQFRSRSRLSFLTPVSHSISTPVSSLILVRFSILLSHVGHTLNCDPDPRPDYDPDTEYEDHLSIRSQEIDIDQDVSGDNSNNYPWLNYAVGYILLNRLLNYSSILVEIRQPLPKAKHEKLI